MSLKHEGSYRVAIDIGGTFVDAVSLRESDGAIATFKTSLTPDDPVAGVMAALKGLGVDLSAVTHFIHGTTLGLNAILENKGARLGLITNEGFRDILEIGRGDVPAAYMYDLQYARSGPTVRRRNIVGVPGRITWQGLVETELDEAAVVQAARFLIDECQLQCLAIVFLNSYANPEHERRAKALICAAYPEASVSASYEMTREYREYERTTSTVIAGQVRPILDKYLSVLESRMTEEGFHGSLWVMRSAGGAMSAQLARNNPLPTIFSGPAGGIAAARYLALETGRLNVISLDIGGTSLDACVVKDGEPALAYEASIGGLPMLTPVFDLRTIGAGGGSIARSDDGILKVGPESAGASPGPACYMRGGEAPTLTDAAVLLGYLHASDFLAGRMEISADRAASAIHDGVATKLDIGDDAAAAGIFRIVTAKTVGSLRELTIERGLDPRDFSVMAFGGFGPIIASFIMRELGLQEVIVPIAAGVFSAWGMLVSELQHDVAQSVVLPLTQSSFPRALEALQALDRDTREALTRQHVPPTEQRIQWRAQLRYVGQEHSLAVLWPEGATVQEMTERFTQEHQREYGHDMTGDVEIVTCRVHGAAEITRAPKVRADARVEVLATSRREARAFDGATGEFRTHRFYDRGSMTAGSVFAGPAVVLEDNCTVVIGSDQRGRVDAHGNLVIRQQDPAHG